MIHFYYQPGQFKKQIVRCIIGYVFEVCQREVGSFEVKMPSVGSTVPWAVVLEKIKGGKEEAN